MQLENRSSSELDRIPASAKLGILMPFFAGMLFHSSSALTFDAGKYADYSAKGFLPCLLEPDSGVPLTSRIS